MTSKMVARLRLARTLLVLFLWIWAAAPAAAHDGSPLYLHVVENGTRGVRLDVRMPPSITSGNTPRIALKPGCTLTSSVSMGEAAEQLLFRCAGGIHGKSLTIDYPIANPVVPTLISVDDAAGLNVTHVLLPNEQSWRIPRARNWAEVAGDYLISGVRHIWSGLDHLLFVTGLLLLARDIKRTLLTVTGFTVAHSITLALSTLDVIRAPGPPTEAAIALSILFLARELVRPTPQSFARRYPLAVSTTFGLLHGFGFASVLTALGLPRDRLLTGLVSFNLGVEIGQLTFIAAVLALAFAARRLWRPMVPFTELFGLPHLQPDRLWGSILGVLAGFWLLQRLTVFA